MDNINKSSFEQTEDTGIDFIDFINNEIESIGGIKCENVFYFEVDNDKNN